MPIDFPSSPTTNQTYTYGGKTWTYNGTGWQISTTYLSQSLSQNAIFTAPIETTTIIPTGTSGSTTYNIDLSASSLWIFGTTTASTASGGFTLNFRSSSSQTLDSLLAANNTITATVINKTGAVTTSYPSTIQIDGTSLVVGTSLFWIGGYAPISGNQTSLDSYTFSITKISTNTYIVTASQARFA